MSKLLQTALMAASLILALGGEAPAGATPAEVAVDRCNGQTIDDASARLRDYDRHPPGASSGQLLARFGAIADVMQVIYEERQILESVCSSETQRTAFTEQIAETTAWALALEADVAARLNASCPAAAQALPTMMLSDAWLSLANVVNGEGGTVPKRFSDVIPKVQTRAQAVGLVLTPWSETSAYWRDQVHAKAKMAVATCPTPSPSPSPSPSATLRLRSG
ncbi:MAG: hypothetical protein WBE77_13115 [Candidatus Cybelea sp.]